MSTPLLRLRSDDQLLASFRAGNDEAFRAIHDRYRQRLFAYTRQMLPGSGQDAEDALQDVFIRAYSGLRTNRRPLALRPWLYRVAHNRCIDELRRPVPPPLETLHLAGAPTYDPATRAEQRESLQRLIADLRRLPDQQRSALLMRELGGMTYADVASAMEVSVPAVKSLLVRARIGLALAVEARDTACVEIRDELTLAHDRGVRPSGTVRRHLAGCGGCREFRAQVRGSSRQFAALVPALGPIGVVAKLLGIGGGGAAGGGAGAAATGGATATTGAAVGGGAVASIGTFTVGATHVGTLIAAAVVTAGGAVAIQHTIAPVHHRHVVHVEATTAPSAAPAGAPLLYGAGPSELPASASTPSPSTASATAKQAKAVTTGNAAEGTGSTSSSGGDSIVSMATGPGGATSTTGASAGQTPTGAVSSTGAIGTGTSGTGASGTGTSGTGTTGTSTSTGTAGATSGSSSAAGSGTTGTTDAAAGTGAGASTPGGSANPPATTASAGSTAGTTVGAPTGTPTGT